MKKGRLSTLAAGLLALPMAASAGPTVTALGGDQFRATFDAMTFTVTAGGFPVAAVVFEDFFAANAPSCGSAESGSVQTSVNGSAVKNLEGNTCTGAYDALNAVDGNDLLVTIDFTFENLFGNVAAGDSVTVSSQDYVFSLAGLNPAANGGPFNAFLVNNYFERMSNIVPTTPNTGGTVPEPSSLALATLALTGLGAAGRRRRAAQA